MAQKPPELFSCFLNAATKLRRFSLPTQIATRHVIALAVFRVKLTEPKPELLNQLVFFRQYWVADELFAVPNHDVTTNVYAFRDY